MWVKLHKNSGFTLLELLIVIALSSIVILGVYQGYFILKKSILTYYQNIQLQNNIKSVSHEFYQVTAKAEKFGCATAKQKTYLHWSKNLGLAQNYLLYENNKPLLNTIILKKNDSRLKNILAPALYNKLKTDSDILYTVQAENPKDNKNHKHKINVYADCQDIFLLSHDDSAEYFYQHKQYEYVGILSINWYFIASSKRFNNQGHPIYSLYRYNNMLGAQEIAEGVDLLTVDSTEENKIALKILINSVEGNPPLKKWFTLAI